METRVFVPEFATREINSPGEPGVCLPHGHRLHLQPRARRRSAGILADMRQRAARRNRDMAARVNAHLAPADIDYDRDVLPLTPAGQCHRAPHAGGLHSAAAAAAPAPDLAAFWADRLGLPPNRSRPSLADGPKFQNLVRAKLMKHGGVGYVQPGPESFPTVEEFHRLIVACGALPCATWLDGTSAGEQAIERAAGPADRQGRGGAQHHPRPQLEHRRPARPGASRCRSCTRWWRSRSDLRAAAERRHRDERLRPEAGGRLRRAELAPVREAFLDGAYFVYGHTVLQRALRPGLPERLGAGASARPPPSATPSTPRLGRLLPPGKAGLRSRPGQAVGRILAACRQMLVRTVATENEPRPDLEENIMTDKLRSLTGGRRTAPQGPNVLWPLYGAGLENLGQDGKPIEAPLPSLRPGRAAGAP